LPTGKLASDGDKIDCVFDEINQVAAELGAPQLRAEEQVIARKFGTLNLRIVARGFPIVRSQLLFVPCVFGSLSSRRSQSFEEHPCAMQLLLPTTT
jgi:hypothetical protein